MASERLGDNNFLTGFIQSFLDPTVIYEHFTYVAVVITIAPWLFTIFLVVRLMQESAAGASGKAALGEAIGDINKSLILFMGYAAGGTLIFALLWVFSELFSGFGSDAHIARLLLETRAELMVDEEAQKEWWQMLAEGAVDFTNSLNVPLAFTAFHLTSIGFTILNNLIAVAFAIGLSVTYAWGFIAIPTRTMRESFNLTPGFIKTLLTFFIWVILEPLLMFFVWMLGSTAAESMAASYGGVGYGATSIMVWYVFATALMTLTIILKLAAPFLAFALAQNQSMVGALGAGPAAMGMIIANQITRRLMNPPGGGGGGPGRGIFPSAGGGRKRDTLADVFQKPLGGKKNDISDQGPGG